jgi:hypothetical protein
MSERIGISILIAFILFAAYSWYTTNKEGFDINSQSYEEVHVYTPPVEAPSNRVVASGGPSAPNQLPPPGPPVVVSEERPFDPQTPVYESAELPEKLRHPERMFGPGLQNDDVQTAVAAGTASYASQETQKAHQTFGPEFAQNGGLFMGEVMANDTSLKNDYSSV